MKGRGKLVKAMAIRDWRLELKVWKAWRRFIQERKERRARDQLARWLQREKRLEKKITFHGLQIKVDPGNTGWDW